MAYTEASSFCAVTDVEGRYGRGTFSGTTAPTRDQVIDMMGARAGEIAGRVRRQANVTLAPPLPTTSSQEQEIERLARQANAFLAAGDALAGHEVHKTPEGKLLAEGFWAEGQRLLDDLVALEVAVASTAESGLVTIGTTRDLIPFDEAF